MVSPLSDDAARQIAGTLHDTGQNIYRVVEEVIGRKLEGDEHDTVYEQVCRAGAIFKCEECSTWKDSSERAEYREDQCAECENEDGQD